MCQPTRSVSSMTKTVSPMTAVIELTVLVI